MYTLTTLTIKFRASNDIPANSIISIEFPFFIAGDSYSSFLNPTTSNVQPSSQVAYSTTSTSSSSHFIELTTKVDILAGSDVSFVLTNVYTPLSTSPVTGINLSVLTASRKVFLKGVFPAVYASTPLPFLNFIVSQSTSLVGAANNLTISFKVAANALPGSYLDLTTSEGLDLTSAMTPPSVNYIITVISRNKARVTLSSTVPITKGGAYLFTINNVLNDVVYH